jgi:hypothetical protein
MSNFINNITSSQLATSEFANNEIEQNVHIVAEFPNATDKESIEEAFMDLVNLAAQEAYKNTRG